MNWIVIAWVEEIERFDPRTRKHVTERTPRACVWIKNGTPRDAQKARAYVKEEIEGKIEGLVSCGNGRVFVYPMSECEPLRRARIEVMG
jgi:hypothetical protein